MPLRFYVTKKILSTKGVSIKSPPFNGICGFSLWSFRKMFGKASGQCVNLDWQKCSNYSSKLTITISTFTTVKIVRMK